MTMTSFTWKDNPRQQVTVVLLSLAGEHGIQVSLKAVSLLFGFWFWIFTGCPAGSSSTVFYLPISDFRGSTVLPSRMGCRRAPYRLFKKTE